MANIILHPPQPEGVIDKDAPPRVFPPPAILDAAVLSMCILNYI